MMESFQIPGASDAPIRFSTTLLKHDEGSPTSDVYSSRGVGEPPINLAAAVPIAIRQAIKSYR